MAWRVVIAGGGFGGFYPGRTLERTMPAASTRTALVSDVDFMLDTPLLPGAELSYDQVVVAVGSISRTLSGLLRAPAAAETLDDPAEPEAWLTYVFVGAGYAGLEGRAELQDFAADAIERYPRCGTQGTRGILVEAAARVILGVSPDLAEFAVRELRGRGLEIRTETTLAALTAAGFGAEAPWESAGPAAG